MAATPGEILYNASPELEGQYSAWEEAGAEEREYWEKYAKNLEVYGFRGQR